MYLSLYGHNPVVRIVMTFASVSLLFGCFMVYSLSGLFTYEAHKPYNIANSLMVKKRLGVRTKWKVS